MLYMDISKNYRILKFHNSEVIIFKENSLIITKKKFFLKKRSFKDIYLAKNNE